MSRSWREVKADKLAIDREAGRDVDVAHAAGREATQVYVDDHDVTVSASQRDQRDQRDACA